MPNRILDFYNRFASVANTRISARAITTYMRQGAKVRTAQERAQFYPNTQSGPGALRRMSGRLASSVGGQDFTGDRESIVNITVNPDGVSLEKGSRTPYAGANEFGFDGTVTIPGHTRRITQAFGRQIEPRDVQVRSYSKNMSIPARPYLKPAISAEEKFLLNWLSEHYKDILTEQVKPNV